MKIFDGEKSIKGFSKSNRIRISCPLIYEIVVFNFVDLRGKKNFFLTVSKKQRVI